MFTTTGEPSRSHRTVLRPRSCRRPQSLNLGHKTTEETWTWERSVGRNGRDGERKEREHEVKIIRTHYIHAWNVQREIELSEHWLEVWGVAQQGRASGTLTSLLNTGRTNKQREMKLRWTINKSWGCLGGKGRLLKQRAEGGFTATRTWVTDS